MLADLWIGVGSALCGMARYRQSGSTAARFGEAFPWGAFSVTVRRYAAAPNPSEAP